MRTDCQPGCDLRLGGGGWLGGSGREIASTLGCRGVGGTLDKRQKGKSGRGRGEKRSLFTCLELRLCPEITNVSSQLEQLETLYLPFSKEEGRQELTAASSWQPPQHAVRLRSPPAWEGSEEGGELRSIMFVGHRREGRKSVPATLTLCLALVWHRSRFSFCIGSQVSRNAD